MSVFGLLVYRNTHRSANRLGFQHHCRNKAEHVCIIQYLVRRRARQCADGVDGHIAPKLVPDIFLNALGQSGIKTCIAQ